MRVLAPVLCAAVLLAGCSSQVPATQPSTGAAPSAPTAPIEPLAMPQPQRIDESWRVDDQPEGGGHPQDGAAASWLAPRDPAELVWGLGALGCPQTVGPGAYPLPRWAQQGRYRTADGSAAVALQLRYEQAADAGELLTAMGRDAAGCSGPEPVAPSSYERRYVVGASTPDSLQVSFKEYGPGVSGSTWHVLGARAGEWVGLFFVEQPGTAGIELPDPGVLLPP